MSQSEIKKSNKLVISDSNPDSRLFELDSDSDSGLEKGVDMDSDLR